MSDDYVYTAAEPSRLAKKYVPWERVDCPPLDGDIGPDSPVRVKRRPIPRPKARKLRRCKDTPDLFGERK